jgi:hypothetical protein
MFYVGLDIHDKRIAICGFNSPVTRSALMTTARTLIVFPPVIVSVLWIGPRSGPNRTSKLASGTNSASGTDPEGLKVTS